MMLFSGHGDYCATTSSFASSLHVLIASWPWVDELLKNGAASWTAFSNSMQFHKLKYCKQEFCAHGPYRFVQSHCVENLILFSSMKNRLNTDFDPVADAEFVAGLGPNANGFIQSYVAMDNSAGYSTHTALFREYHKLLVSFRLQGEAMWNLHFLEYDFYGV